LSSLSVILAGVVPPPIHGASLATRALFDADLYPIEKHLLEIRSSKDLQEVGKASWKKVFGLFSLVARCILLRFQTGASVLYYTPGSAHLVPFVRDLVFLGLCRCFFDRVVLHYHSGGVCHFLSTNRIRSILGRWIYGRGAWAITLSEHVAVPGYDFGAARVIEIPNGLDVPDVVQSKYTSPALRILFLGNLYADKGVFDLLEACQLAARSSSKPIELRFVGKWPDEATAAKFRQLCQSTPDSLIIPPPQALYGDQKWQAYAEADLFVFPSYYQSENFPLVVLEAMASGLPIIASRWRGIPSIVQEGVNGFLHEPRDVAAISQLLQRFLQNPHLIEEMGQASKQIHTDRFSFEKHRFSIVKVLMEACASIELAN
jgi:glycosyltransferase involved in cell wall biosynthesis